MKEDFLHYLWRNKKFDISSLQTVCGEEIVILNSGAYLKNKVLIFLMRNLSLPTKNGLEM